MFINHEPRGEKAEFWEESNAKHVRLVTGPFPSEATQYQCPIQSVVRVGLGPVGSFSKTLLK